MIERLMDRIVVAAPEIPPEVFGAGALTVVVVVIALACLLLWIATLFSVLGSSYGLGMKLLAIIACFAFPFLGPLAWFLIVKGNQPSRAVGYRR